MAPFLVVLFAFMFANSEPDRPEQGTSAEAATSSVPTWEQPPIAGGLSGTNEGSGQSPKDFSPKPTSPAPAPPTTNCGRGPDQAHRVAGRGATVGCDDAAGTTPPAPAPADGGGAVPGLPPTHTVDRYDFCTAAVAVSEFEKVVADAIDANAPGEVAAIVLRGRDQWRTDIDTMLVSGPENLRVSITFYRAVMGEAFDSVTASSANQDVVLVLVDTDTTELQDAIGQIGQHAGRTCA